MMFGGIIHGAWEEQQTPRGLRRKSYSFAWGTLTWDAQVRKNDTKKGKSYYITFRLRMRKHVFLRVTVYPDNPFYWQAYRLKKGEPVLIVGEFVAWPYQIRTGETKMAHDLYAQIVIPGLMISDPLAYQELHGNGGNADVLFAEMEEAAEEQDDERIDQEDALYNPFSEPGERGAGFG